MNRASLILKIFQNVLLLIVVIGTNVMPASAYTMDPENFITEDKMEIRQALDSKTDSLSGIKFEKIERDEHSNGNSGQREERVSHPDALNSVEGKDNSDFHLIEGDFCVKDSGHVPGSSHFFDHDDDWKSHSPDPVNLPATIMMFFTGLAAITWVCRQRMIR